MKFFKSPKDYKMHIRHFWESSSYWTSLVSAVLVLIAMDGLQATILSGSILTSYMIGRFRYKMHRGLFYSGLLTSEYHFCVLQQAWATYAFINNSIEPFHAGIAFTVPVVIYTIGRGFVKAIGKKTQVMMT